MDYLGFILASYLATALVLGGLALWVILDGRAQMQALSELDRSGIRRADAAGGGAA